ncbi:MAG: hypothetical protein HY244_03970, partial [Rhizobiales bacterium]|nr:hypothetical protein [Hyphomicrobiales bacterium]
MAPPDPSSFPPLRHRCRKLAVIASLGAAALALLGAAGHAQEHGSKPSEAVFESVYNFLIMTREGSIARFRRMENGATVSA